MKKRGSISFFILAALTLICTYLVFAGISYTDSNGQRQVIVKGTDSIRWGIDIRGGVDAVFVPANGYNANDDELAAARAILEVRLIANGITDYDLYVDNASDRIVVRFPWKEDETAFDDAASAIRELGETALLTMRAPNPNKENPEIQDFGGEIIISGSDLVVARPNIVDDPLYGPIPVVEFKLSDKGKEAFKNATQKYMGQPISIWMDDQLISAPRVNAVIANGEGYIEGGFTAETAKALADKIMGGALPFKLDASSYSTISPTMGLGAKDVMVTAGIIAFVLVCVFMVVMYRVPGLVAIFALIGQVVFMVGSVTRIFPVYPSFTLTLPGIAGIILGIGMGVDANIISAERIKEEIRSGKSVDGAVALGFDRALSSIFDGNITVLIVAVILMGAFGPPDSLAVAIFGPLFSFLGKSSAGSVYSFGYTLLMGVIGNMVIGVYASRAMLKGVAIFGPLFSFLGKSSAGSVYSFGYTLLMGVIGNMVIGVYASRAMLKGASKLKCFRSAWWYGGKRNV